MNTNVYKFGGTSQGSTSALEASMNILNSDKENKVAVVSAPSGITNLLWEGTNEALRKGNIPKNIIEQVANRFNALYKNTNNAKSIILEYKNILTKRFEKIKNIDHNSKNQFIANIVSFGEELESRLYTMLLNQNNISSRLLPEHLIILEGNYLNGTYNRVSDKRIKNEVNNKNEVIVVPGYYGHNLKGERVVFGRGGSDYTQTLFARAINANACYNCTDVNGILPINPNLLPEELRKSLKTIKELSYEQAQELAYQGAKVLHPRCITPLKESKIPLYVINTFDPQGERTLIHESQNETASLVAITGKDDAYMNIKLHAGEMEGQTGYLLAFAQALQGIDIDTITTSSVEIQASFTNKDANLEKVRDQLSKIGDVNIHNGSSLIAVVGNDIGQSNNLGSFLQILTRENIPIGQISKSNENSLWVSIPSRHYQRAQVAVYEELLR